MYYGYKALPIKYAMTFKLKMMIEDYRDLEPIPEHGNDFIADVRHNFLISKGFRQIEDSHLYKVDLPTDGTSLISDIHYNLWIEYWYDGKVDQSVGLGKYSTEDIKTLLGIMLR